MKRRKLSIEKLTVDPVQSREQAWIGDDADRHLADSIDTDGLLQDIIVRPLTTTELNDDAVDGNGATEYGVVAGSRRYFAAMEAGYEEIPCKVIDADDLDAAWKSLSENVDRRDLSEQEIANQLQLIYEMIRPLENPDSCPDCGEAVDSESALLEHCEQTDCELPSHPEQGPPVVDDGTDRSKGRSLSSTAGRFCTDRQALTYLAERFTGRTDDNAVDLVEGHLRTAELPPLLQSLFKSPDDRSAQERSALDNYGIDTRTRLGSGEGKSGTSREIVKLHEAVSTEADGDAVNPTDAVLEAVGSLQFEQMSEQELRRTLRDFRHEVTTELDPDTDASTQQEAFRETLQRCASELAETYEEVEPTRPFRKVDVLGPETQQHSRWHVRAMQQRNASGHGELVKELYQERLEELAEQKGWS